MDAKYGLNGFATVGDNSSYNSVFNKVQGQLNLRQLIKTARTIRSGVQVWRAGSIAATVILIADDATIVGVLDDVALPATLTSVAVTFILIEALDYYIIPKKQGQEVGDRLRECLKNKRKIDIDSAVNGVCLPKGVSDDSAAFPHR